MSELVLRTEGVTKRFGSLTAVLDVDFELERGETKSLIGPNGAGKTTLINCLTGTYDLSDGEIYFHGERVTDAPTPDRVTMGMGRSYQNSNLFEEFTVLENVRLAKQIDDGNVFDVRSHYRSKQQYVDAAREALEQFDLASREDVKARALSHGEKRLLELAMVLVQDPDVLLLDEPTAGMATDRLSDITETIEDVKDDYAVLLIEHNLDVVMSLSDSIMVLNQGEKIADGTPEDIRADPQVREAYLGTEVGDLGGAR